MTWKHFIKAPKIFGDVCTCDEKFTTQTLNYTLKRKCGGKGERERKRCNLWGPRRVSETAINYVRAEATGIRVASLFKLRATFVSPIVTESLLLLCHRSARSLAKKGDKNSLRCKNADRNITERYSPKIINASCTFIRSSDILTLFFLTWVTWPLQSTKDHYRRC